MKLFYIYILLSLSILPWSNADNTNFVFNKMVHDFGTFSEDGLSQTCVFIIKNTGDSPIAINHVQSTCGCAVASYTKTPIFSGKTGEVKITYNPQGHPGKFNRSILVSIAGQTAPTKLTITGVVTPGAKRKHANYPVVIGDLQLKASGMSFSPMRGDIQEQSIKVINSGNRNLQLIIRSTDSSLAAKGNPGLLLPNVNGEILITRIANQDKTNPKCIRIQEDKTAKAEPGKVYLLISTEKCK